MKNAALVSGESIAVVQSDDGLEITVPTERREQLDTVIALTLAPRSVYVMQDDIRWRWQHSIPPAKALRYSMTFRTAA